MDTVYDAKLLIVDDNAELLALLCEQLRGAGYGHIRTAQSCAAARACFAAEQPELMILDINLPDGDGFSLFRALRAKADVPALFLSARDADADRLLGLGLGADDYLTKPVDLDELLLHVQALLRRSQAMTSHQLTIGQTHLDYDSLTVQRGDTLLTLPKKEFFLLFKLLSSPMQIFTRRQLMDEIWGMDAQSDERTVDVHIKRLREKCEIFPDFSIVTVRGLGYKAVKNG